MAQETRRETTARAVQERTNEADMDEAVGKRLPDRSVQEGVWDKSKQSGHLACRGWSSYSRQIQNEVSNQIDDDQAPGRAVEVGERKRGGADPRHGIQQVKPFNMRVSCAAQINPLDSLRRFPIQIVLGGFAGGTLPRIVAGLDAVRLKAQTGDQTRSTVERLFTVCFSLVIGPSAKTRLRIDRRRSEGDHSKCADRLDFAICRGIADRKTSMVYSPQLGVPRNLEFGLT